MKSWLLLLIFISFALTACSDDPGNETSGKARIDDNFETTVEWERNKVINSAGSKLKLGKRELSFNISDVNLTTNGDMKVTRSCVRYGEKATVCVEIDLTDLRALQIREGNLSVDDPDYLDLENYPTATVEFDLNRSTYTNNCRVKVKGSTYVCDAIWEGEAYDKTWTSIYAEIPVDGIQLGLYNTELEQDLESDTILLTLNLNKKDNGKNPL